MTLYDEAKSKFTILDVARLLGIGDQIKKQKFKSPFRPDRNASCSLYDEGRRYRDWSTGDDGDIADFYAMATGCEKNKAPILLVDLLVTEGLLQRPEDTLDLLDKIRPQRPSVPKKVETKVCEIPVLPADLRPLSEADCRHLGAMRRLNPGAFDLASTLGVLRMGTVHQVPSWILCDEGKINYEARRLDGKHYPAAGPLGERKSHSLRNSDKTWPVGLYTKLQPFNDARHVLLVEGMVDYMAALDLIAHYIPPSHRPENILVIAMLGATCQKFHPEALTLLSGKRIKIVGQNDDAGRNAARDWYETLITAGKGILVERIEIENPDKDLCDLMARLSEDDKETLATDVLRFEK